MDRFEGTDEISGQWPLSEILASMEAAFAKVAKPGFVIEDMSLEAALTELGDPVLIVRAVAVGEALDGEHG